jgi:hypothetical protein
MILRKLNAFSNVWFAYSIFNNNQNLHFLKKLSLLVVLFSLIAMGLNAQFELKGLIGTNFSSLTKPPEG